MRKLITLFAVLCAASLAFGQRAVEAPADLKAYKALPESRYLETLQDVRPSNATPVGAIGSVSGSAVTAVKVGEASNAFTSLVLETNQVYSMPAVGNGGTVAFLNRQNIQNCGGVTVDNGRYRFSISIDGGATWNIGSGNFVPPAATNTCYGIGTVNPTYTRSSRYPNVALFSRSSSTSADSLGLVYCGPVLQPGNSGWDGSVVGTVLNIADSAGTQTSLDVTQEDYVYQNGNQYFNYTLISQVDTRSGAINFWYGSRSWDGSTVGSTFFLNKGVYDAASKTVNWSVAETINLPYYTGYDGTERAASFTVAFSPNGQHGWIGMVGDLIGGTDTVYNPIFIHSDDYGDTWGAPQEIDINAFPALQDTLLDRWIAVDPNTNDTIPYSTGKVTTIFSCDMEVDNNGDPHMLTAVGHASNLDNPQAQYSIFSGLGMYLFDVTKDAFGDWNMMYIGQQLTLRGEFGDPTDPSGSGSFTEDTYTQVTRSEDGTKIFFSWSDTDTAATGGNDNNAPDLWGRAYDLTSNKLTNAVNWTANDLDWASNVVIPKTANAALRSGTVFKVPTVIVSLDNQNAIQPISFWYFQDVEYDTDTEFTDDPIFFYNCKENPFANMPTINDASCAMNNDGSITIAAGGGVSPYAFQWDTGNAADTTNALSGLAAGVYTGFVTDEEGCVDTLTAIVSNIGAPTATIDPVTVTDPSCFGASDGSATVTATGGGGGTMFSWNTSAENTAAAVMLPAGRSTVTVTDMNGCASFAFVDLNEPPAIIIETAGTDITCFGDGNGSAEVTLATGGVGGFSYEWDDPAMTTGVLAIGLDGGTYTVTVTDANGCTTTATETIDEPAELTANTSIFKPTDCGVTFDGTASATAGGGTSPFTYAWENITAGGSAGTGSFIFGLDCGFYRVTIEDANGCIIVVDSIDLTKIVSIEDEIAAGINSWELFPNPASADVNIEISLNQNDDVRMQIVDLHGRTVIARSFDYGLNIRETVSLNDVPAGIYMVQLSTSQGTATRKLVVK